MEETIKNNPRTFRNILIGIAVGAALILVFFGGIGYQKKVSTASEKYLQEQVEAAQQKADYWEEKYNAAYGEKTTLLLKVDSLDYRLKELKKNYAKKVVTVKSYTNPELEQFFADRYGD